MILAPIAITFAVILICAVARPRDQEWEGSFVILVLLAAAVLAATWGVYGAALWISGDWK